MTCLRFPTGPFARLLPALGLSAALAAQVPTASIVVLDWFAAGPTFGANQFGILDPAGGGMTQLFGITPFGAPAMTGIATDPASATDLYFLGPTAGTMPGIHTVPIGLLGAPGSVTNAPWPHPGGRRLRVHGADLYTLEANAITRSPKAGGPPVPVLTQPDAVDIALHGSFLYVACRDAANPSAPMPLIEWNLTTSTPRVVGSYANVRRIAVDPTGTVLAYGTTSQIVRVSLATGGTLGSTPTTNGAVLALVFTEQGDIVHGEGNGLGYTIRRSGMAAPLYEHDLADLTDLAIATAVTASAVPFTFGCGAAGPVTWTASNLPQLGVTFQFGIDGAPPNTPAPLFLSDSRVFSTIHGAALPMDLTAYGAPGCSLLVDPLVGILLPIGANGSAGSMLPIPASPMFAGIEWYAQAFVFDPGLQPYQFAATGGLAFRLNP